MTDAAVAAAPADPFLTAPSSATRRLARAMLLGAFAWAGLVLSGPFLVAEWIVGDIAYHRGVASTMIGAAWQGEGPFVGLLTYYGGLYPLLVGRLASAIDVPFDLVLSVLSWPFGLVWPAACWWLARRIWPGQPLPVACFVLLATVTAPFTHRVLLWVDSPLASAQDVAPLFPRDVALILLVVALGFVLDGRRRARVVGIGLSIGGIVLVHLQMALLAGFLVSVLAIAQSVRRRERGPLLELVAAGALALLVSAWWWIPRVAAAVASRGLWLGGYPGAPPFRLGPDNVFMAFGVMAVLALLGLAVLAARSRPFPRELAPFLLCVVVLLPLVVVDRVIGGSDLVSERRLWLIMSIPLTLLAAWTAAGIIGRLRPLSAAAAVVLVLVVPSIPGTFATAALVRDAWEPGRAGGRLFDAAAWDPMFADLLDRVERDGRHVTLTYDAYATWVWSFSGSQVPSLWLPGPFKLGFDPAVLTGTGYLERVRAQEAAFSGGLPTICVGARASGAGSVILDVRSGRLGILDSTPASPYRVDPSERSQATIRRTVGAGLTYLDNGGYDALRLALGTTWSPPFEAPPGSLVSVEWTVPVALIGPDGVTVGDLFRIEAGSGKLLAGAGLSTGFAQAAIEVGPEGGPITVTALRDSDLLRVTAFVPSEAAIRGTRQEGDGPSRFDPADLCGAGS